MVCLPSDVGRCRHHLLADVGHGRARGRVADQLQLPAHGLVRAGGDDRAGEVRGDREHGVVVAAAAARRWRRRAGQRPVELAWSPAWGRSGTRSGLGRRPSAAGRSGSCRCSRPRPGSGRACSCRLEVDQTRTTAASSGSSTPTTTRWTQPPAGPPGRSSVCSHSSKTSLLRAPALTRHVPAATARRLPTGVAPALGSPPRGQQPPRSGRVGQLGGQWLGELAVRTPARSTDNVSADGHGQCRLDDDASSARSCPRVVADAAPSSTDRPRERSASRALVARRRAETPRSRRRVARGRRPAPPWPADAARRGSISVAVRVDRLALLGSRARPPPARPCAAAGAHQHVAQVAALTLPGTSTG